MTKIFAVNDIDTQHLEEVITKMRELGTPVIRVIQEDDGYLAIEGSHRLAACAQLGINPTIEILSMEDCSVMIDGLDLDAGAITSATIGDVYDYLFRGYRHRPAFSFDI